MIVCELLMVELGDLLLVFGGVNFFLDSEIKNLENCIDNFL